MIILAFIFFVSLSAYASLSVCSSIKYQVRFYTKLYSQFLNRGMSENDAMQYLVSFYLKGEAEWKVLYMHGRLSDYVESFDEFVLDLALFHHHIHPWQQSWEVNIINKKSKIDDIISQLNVYLSACKRKYLGTNFAERPANFFPNNQIILEIKANLDRLYTIIEKMDRTPNKLRFKKHIKKLKSELNSIENLLYIQNNNTIIGSFNPLEHIPLSQIK